MKKGMALTAMAFALGALSAYSTTGSTSTELADSDAGGRCGMRAGPRSLVPAVWRPSNGNWYQKGLGMADWAKSVGRTVSQAGMVGDVPVPADWYGEGSMRMAVWRPRNGMWYIKESGLGHWGEGTGNKAIQCGVSGDIPVPADYNGEGQPRIAVWKPINGIWYVKGWGMDHWGATKGNQEVQCGKAGDFPVPADYYGEGKARMAVWRPSNGIWYIKGDGWGDWGVSKGNAQIQCGMAGDIPVAADYYGEGKPRIAVWRPSNGNWYIKGPGRSHWGASKGNKIIQLGMAGDIPIPRDWFGEGMPRITVFRPSKGYWYIKAPGVGNWGSPEDNSFQMGTAGDVPLALGF